MTTGTTYKGILVRTSLEDTGTIPRSGALQESPDVIPYGSAPVDDPQTLFTENYDENVSKPVVADQKNLIYIRGKNGAEFTQSGEAFLYWAPEDKLNDPANWKRNQLLTSQGRGSEELPDVESDAIAVAGIPFEWIPDATLAGKSIVLLGVIATNERPNPVPGLKSPINFDRWISEHGGVGALQVTIVAPPAPSPTLGTSAAYALANEQGVVDFTLRTKSIPAGSTVSFKASKPDSAGNPIELKPTKVTSNPFVTVVSVTVASNFTTQIEFKLYLPSGQKAGVDNEISVEATQTPKTTTGPAKPKLLAKYASQVKFPTDA